MVVKVFCFVGDLFRRVGYCCVKGGLDFGFQFESPFVALFLGLYAFTIGFLLVDLEARNGRDCVPKLLSLEDFLLAFVVLLLMPLCLFPLVFWDVFGDECLASEGCALS